MQKRSAFFIFEFTALKLFFGGISQIMTSASINVKLNLGLASNESL
jgi:hypothetical protein